MLSTAVAKALSQVLAAARRRSRRSPHTVVVEQSRDRKGPKIAVQSTPEPVVAAQTPFEVRRVVKKP